METIIYNDINNLLFSISKKYNLNLDMLNSRYIPTIKIEKNKEKKTRIAKKHNYTHKPPEDHVRCKARIWGYSNTPVKYDLDAKNWIYGEQCTHTKYAHFPQCYLHHKQIKKYGSLPHGNFDEPPPHAHYNKFKIKIQKNFNIKQ